MKAPIVLLSVALMVSAPVFAQTRPGDCAREAQDYAAMTAPKSGGKVVRNTVNGIVVPVPQRDTTQLARGRDGSTVSGFARVDQYAANREAEWVGRERCEARRR